MSPRVAGRVRGACDPRPRRAGRGALTALVLAGLWTARPLEAQSIYLGTSSIGPLSVTTAVAGSATSTATASGSYSIFTSNNTPRVITARLSASMPAGFTLEVNVAPPTNSGTGAGWVVLTTTAQNVVTGIAKTYNFGTTSSFQYRLTAPVTSQYALSSRSVTFAIQ